MSDKRVWILAGALFVLAAVVSFVGGNAGTGAAFVAVAVLFFVMPDYLERKKRPKP